jgi:hypothetical protein
MFKVRVRYSYALNDAGVSVQKNIEQIFIVDTYSQELAKRFISDFMMKVDANTNALKMALFVTMSIFGTVPRI